MFGPGHVPRPALSARITESNARVVVLRGPSGYGKSTVVAEWLRDDDPASGVRVPWSAGVAMGKARFWQSLLTTIASTRALADDHPVVLLAQKITATRAVLPEDIESLVEAVADSGTGVAAPSVALILDSLDLVSDREEVEEQLSEVLRRLPWLRLVVVGRTRSVFERIEVRLELSATVVGPDDLVFDDDEIETALGARALESHRPQRLAEIVRATERVPVLVRLAVLELEGAAEWQRLPAGVEQRLRRHLVETVLRGSAKHLTGLGGGGALFAFAAADHLTAELAAELTGKDGHAIVATLESVGLGLVAPLVVTRLDGSGDVVGAFAFSTGIRDALRERARDVDAGAWRESRLAFSRWAHANGLPVEALAAAVDAADYDFASRVVVDYVFELGSLNKGAVERVLARVPARTLAAWPLLAAMRALDNFGIEGRQWRTGEYFTLAAVGIALRRPSASPPDRLLYTVIEMIAFRLAVPASDRAKRAATRAAAAVADLTPEERVQLQRILSIITTQIGTTQLNTGDAVGAALTVTEAGTDAATIPPHLRYSALALRSGAHALSGRLAEARRDLDASDAIPGMQWRHHNVFGSPARIAEAVLHLEAWHAAGADRALSGLREHYPTIENLHLLLLVETWRHLVAGTPDEGYEFVLGALDDALLQRRLAPFVDAGVQHQLALLALAGGRLGAAREHAEGTDALDPFTRTLLDAQLALALQGSTTSIRRLFDSPPRTDSATSPRRRTELALLRLAAAMRTESGALIDRAATQALALLSRYDLHLPLLVLDPSSLHGIAERAKSDERFAALATLAAPHTTRLPSWASVPLPRLTPREREIFEALVWTASAASIAQSLGTSTNTVKKQLSSLYRKLGVTTRADALEYAQAYGIAAR